jgi:hypothetical protein
MRLVASVVVLIAVSAAPVLAKNKHWHEDDKHGNKHARYDDDRDRHDCYFRPDDVRIIREYYVPRYRSLPPDLAKKYYRTGHLPPGWQKKLEPIPVVVDRRLVPLPYGYRRGYIDGTVVIYSPRTQVVVDVVTLFTP